MTHYPKVAGRLGRVSAGNPSLKLDERGVTFMRASRLLTLLLICVPLGSALGQEKAFQWLPANDESVRLDPANYHAGRVYHPGPDGGGMHIDVQSALPVTVAMARSDDWNQALQHPESV